MTDYKKEKKAPGSESVVCGIHAVESYLAKGTVVRLFHTAEFHHPLVKEAKRRGLPVGKMRKSELDLYAAHENHQGVVAFVRGYRYLDFHELLDKVASEKEPIIVFLDRLTDPHNLGAIARSAYLFGASGIVIPAKGSASVTVGAVKASSGATGHISIARAVNMGKALDLLVEQGFSVGGLVMDGETALAQADLTGPLALVVGSEDKGIRPSLLSRVDKHLSIPMAGKHIGSFNASVAAAVVLYETRRQRMQRLDI